MLHSSFLRKASIAAATVVMLSSSSLAFAEDPLPPSGFVPGDNQNYGYTTEDKNGNGLLDEGEDINGDGTLQTFLVVPADDALVVPPTDDKIAPVQPATCINGTYIQLENGGSVNSQQEYANGCTVNFTWEYYSYGPPTYGDQLHVCFGTDTDTNFWPSGSIVGGIDVVMNTVSDQVYVMLFNPPNQPVQLGVVSYDFVEGQQYNLSVTHNPNGNAADTITVKINDVVVNTVTIPAGFESFGDYVQIHNRESVAQVYHWCSLQDVNIAPLLP